jgi:hypothetical protein
VTPKKTTSGSRLDAREVVVVGVRDRKRPKKTTSGSRLDAEGGGGGGSRVETPKSTTSGSRLDAREVVVVAGTPGIVFSWWYGQ